MGLDLAAPAIGCALFEATQGDIRDVHLLYRLIRRHRFDAVVHCGGISGAMVAPNDPFRNVEVNVFATAHLLQAAYEHGVERFVYCSSQAAYGRMHAVSALETATFQPASVYGATKAACDSLVTGYRNHCGLSAVSLRIGRVYGPGRKTESVIFAMLEAAVKGIPLRLPASGGQRLQYVYDADVTSGLYAALNALSLPQHAYNLSGPGEYTTEEIAGTIRKLVPGADISFHKNEEPSYDRAPLDYSAAQRDFDYRPKYDLDSGLAMYFEWMQRQ